MTAKKLLALVLALVLCVGVLSACKQEPAETKPAETKPAETKPAETKPAETQPTETEPAAPLLNKDLYPISSEHTFKILTTRADIEKTANWHMMVDTIGLDVEWVSMTNEQVPLTFIDENSMPDIYFQPGGLTAQQINEFGKSGLLVNYADYLELMPNLQAWIDEFPNFLDSVLQEDGAFYMLPGYSGGLTAPGNLFYIRLDHTTEAGWETLPTTIEEFLVMCEDLKNYNKDVEGYVPMVCNGAASIAWNGAYCNFFFPAFGELMRSDITVNADATKIEIGFATEQFKNYLAFMRELYEKGYMDPDCFVADSNTSKAKLIDEKTTMNPFATYLTPENFESGKMDFQVMPPLSSQYQSEARWTSPNRWVVRQYMINAKCPDIEAAVQFLDAFYAPRENPLNEEGTIWGIGMWLGEFGKDFVTDEEAGTYVILDHEGFENGSTWLSTVSSGSNIAQKWDYVENGGTGLMMKALGVRDILRPHDVNIFYTTLLMLTDDELETYNDCWNEIQTKVVEMNAAFITGQADLEADWDTYIDDLYAMGLQDVIDVYQAALDRYNAR